MARVDTAARARTRDRGERFELRYRNYKGEDVVYRRTDSRVLADRFLRILKADPCREDQRLIDRQLALFDGDRTRADHALP
jgi:citrate synthase